MLASRRIESLIPLKGQTFRDIGANHLGIREKLPRGELMR
jgi:hypothetical protein